MTALTQAEAVERARLLAVTSYAVELDLTTAPVAGADGETFASRAVVRFRCVEPGAATFADVKARRVRSATLNGAPLDPGAVIDGRLPLQGLAADNELVVEANMAFSRDGQGLHRAVDPADGATYVFGHLFLDAAPRVFACFDQPDLKAPYDVRVRAPQGWTVVGNGIASPGETPTGPGDGAAEGDATWWTLGTTRPLATYFVTVCAGPYAHVRDEHRGIPLGLYARASLGDRLRAQAGELLTLTKAGLDYYEPLFGIDYPFGGYDQVFVPEFNAGAMENPGCVVLRDQMIFRGEAGDAERMARADTVLHEMAHMWFGDLVTMRWWDDLWLNESFAEYLAHRAAAEVTDLGSPWAEFTIARKTWGYAAERSPSTHPVAGNPAPDAAAALANFDGISYAKGAAVLAQLSAYLGDDGFLAGVRDHLRRAEYGNASLADFLAAMERVTGRDLGPWSRGWLRTAGLDEIAVELGEEEGRQVAIVRRTGPEDVDRAHAIDVAGYRAGREVWRRGVLLDAPEVAVPLPEPADPDGLGAALVVPDPSSATWATVRLAEPSVAALPAELPAIEDPVTRAVLWTAVLDALHDARMDPRDIAALAEAALPAERDAALLHGVVFGVLRPTVRSYLTPEERALVLPRLTSSVRRIAADGGPGDATYLVATRARALWENDVAYLRGIMCGDVDVEPLAADADLRWSAATTLAQRGLVDLAALSRRRDEDRTLAGELAFLTARAALPDAASKEWAWRRLTTPGDAVSNYERNALATGFWLGDDEATQGEYVARYFRDIPNLAGHLGDDALARVARLAFPSLVEPATADAARRALAGEGLSDGVRRAIVDGLAELDMALASRARYGVPSD